MFTKLKIRADVFQFTMMIAVSSGLAFAYVKTFGQSDEELQEMLVSESRTMIC